MNQQAAQCLIDARHFFTTESRPAVIAEHVGYQISSGIDPLSGRPFHFIAVVRQHHDKDSNRYSPFFHISYDECKLSYDETEVLGIAHKL